MTEVARLADVRTSSIYHHFSSRDELIEETMWAGIADTRDHLSTVIGNLPPTMTALDRLVAAVGVHVRRILEISDYSTVSIRFVGQVPPRIRRRQLLEEQRYGEIWHRLINDVSREGSLRADLEPYISRMLVFGALNSTVEWWGAGGQSLEEIVANAQSLVRHGLSAAPPFHAPRDD